MANCSSRVEFESTASWLHVACSNRWATGMGHFVNLWFGSLALVVCIGLITVIVFPCWRLDSLHYNDVIMGAIAYQVTSLTIVYSAVYSDADQRKHQSFASLAFVRGIHRGPVNSPHKWPVTRKIFPFDAVIMECLCCWSRPSDSSHCLSHCWLNFSLSFGFNCNHSTRSWICTCYDNRVNSLKPSDAYMRSAKPLSEPMLDYCLLIRTLRTNFSEILSEIQIFALNKIIWKCRLRNGVYFDKASVC